MHLIPEHLLKRAYGIHLSINEEAPATGTWTFNTLPLIQILEYSSNVSTRVIKTALGFLRLFPVRYCFFLVEIFLPSLSQTRLDLEMGFDSNSCSSLLLHWWSLQFIG